MNSFQLVIEKHLKTLLTTVTDTRERKYHLRFISTTPLSYSISCLECCHETWRIQGMLVENQKPTKFFKTFKAILSRNMCSSQFKGETQYVGEKNVQSPCHGLSHFCLLLFWVHCKAVFNESSSFLCDTLKKNILRVTFWVSFL